MAAGLVAALAALGTTAHAATTPEQLCEAGKNRAAANYIACLGKAEKTYVATGDATLYDTDLAKCESGYAAKWGRLERKAEAAGTTCPSTGDQAAIQNFADSCAQSVAVALEGGALPLDAVACNADLGTCNADLSTTNADLATCSTDLSTANAGLGTCNTSLTTCGTYLGTCSGNLASTNFLTSWDFAWGTDFGYGYTYTAWKGETQMVRAVRAGS